jgi:hypothetical protein
MRRIVLILFLLILAFSISYGQKIKTKRVPAEVRTRFKSLYPNINEKDLEWVKEGKIYVCDFLTGNTLTSVFFEIDGKLINTIKDCDLNQLPKPIIDYINKNFKKKNIGSVTKQIDGKGILTYVVELKQREYVFNDDGELIKIRGK